MSMCVKKETEVLFVDANVAGQDSKRAIELLLAEQCSMLFYVHPDDDALIKEVTLLLAQSMQGKNVHAKVMTKDEGLFDRINKLMVDEITKISMTRRELLLPMIQYSQV